MLNLKDKEWHDFKIDKLFEVSGSITTHPSKLTKGGKTPRITCASVNNGLDNLYLNQSTEAGGVLTIDSATIGYVSYQEVDFIATDHVEKIFFKNKKINRNLGLGLITSIKVSALNKFNYGYKFSQKRIKNQKILLPVNEKSEPNYEYMENYTKSIIDKKLEDYKKYAESVLKGIEYKEILPLNQKKIKPFKVEEIFLIENCKCSKAGDLKKGNIPYIGATNRNNGLMGFVKKEEKLLTKGNCMVFICDGQGSVGYSMYKSENFIGSTTLKVGRNKRLNKYIGFFLSTLLDMNKSLYDYGYKRSEKRLKKEQIMIPVNENNEPDYEYMEQYMKNLMYKKINQYLNYKNKEA